MGFVAITWADVWEFVVPAGVFVAVATAFIAYISHRNSVKGVGIQQQALDIDKNAAAERQAALLNVSRGPKDTLLVENGGPATATDIRLVVSEARQGALMDKERASLGPGEEWRVKLGYEMGKFTAQLSWLDGTNRPQERKVTI